MRLRRASAAALRRQKSVGYVLPALLALLPVTASAASTHTHLGQQLALDTAGGVEAAAHSGRLLGAPFSDVVDPHIAGGGALGLVWGSGIRSRSSGWGACASWHARRLSAAHPFAQQLGFTPAGLLSLPCTKL